MLRPRENGENDENGGGHVGKGMVYQRYGFLLPDAKLTEIFGIGHDPVSSEYFSTIFWVAGSGFLFSRWPRLGKCSSQL